MNETPETKYARSGDLHDRIPGARRRADRRGESPGWISHMEFQWEQPLLAHFLRRPASYARLVLFDKRGSGLSDRTAGVPTLEECMDDIRAVMDAEGSQRAALIGHYDSGAHGRDVRRHISGANVGVDHRRRLRQGQPVTRPTHSVPTLP